MRCSIIIGVNVLCWDLRTVRWNLLPIWSRVSRVDFVKIYLESEWIIRRVASSLLGPSSNCINADYPRRSPSNCSSLLSVVCENWGMRIPSRVRNVCWRGRMRKSGTYWRKWFVTIRFCWIVLLPCTELEFKLLSPFWLKAMQSTYIRWSAKDLTPTLMAIKWRYICRCLWRPRSRRACWWCLPTTFSVRLTAVRLSVPVKTLSWGVIISRFRDVAKKVKGRFLPH